MIRSISLFNFKRFDKFTVRAQSGNVLVGPNNSGKSSILDALRLLDAGIRYSRAKRPMLLDTKHGYFDGFKIPEKSLPFSLSNITKDYNAEDAEIVIEHENSAKAYLLLHPDREVRFFIDNGKRFSTSKKFREAFPLDLVIVPTLSPLESHEPLVQPETVQRNRSTRLAARTLRNIWHLESKENFEAFAQKVERAWPGIEILPPELVKSNPPFLEMFLKENRLTREVQWAGFGFQVWLQIHTHIIRGREDSILVMDEPDIYLHPDLQHRLYYDIKEQFRQFFIATHATEIINEAETSEIVVVNPKNKTGKRIRGDQDYDQMLTYIGSAENADFAKISKVRKVIFVEGNDARLIRRIARQLKLNNLVSDQKAPIFRLGGFSEWRRAKNAVWAFKELLGVEIDTLCVFDRDYRSTDEANHFSAQMKKSGLESCVLSRKEIENYLLVPEAIAKAINLELSQKGKAPATVSSDEISDTIFELSAEHKIYVSGQLAAHSVRFARDHTPGKDEATLFVEAAKRFDDEWSAKDGRTKLCPGKDVLAALFMKVKKEHGVSLTQAKICAQLTPNLVDPELVSLLERLNGFLER